MYPRNQQSHDGHHLSSEIHSTDKHKDSYDSKMSAVKRLACFFVVFNYVYHHPCSVYFFPCSLVTTQLSFPYTNQPTCNIPNHEYINQLFIFALGPKNNPVLTIYFISFCCCCFFPLRSLSSVRSLCSKASFFLMYQRNFVCVIWTAVLTWAHKKYNLQKKKEGKNLLPHYYYFYCKILMTVTTFRMKPKTYNPWIIKWEFHVELILKMLVLTQELLLLLLKDLKVLKNIL